MSMCTSMCARTPKACNSCSTEQCLRRKCYTTFQAAAKHQGCHSNMKIPALNLSAKSGPQHSILSMSRQSEGLLETSKHLIGVFERMNGSPSLLATLELVIPDSPSGL